MRKDTHPEYTEITVSCSCGSGNQFRIRSTLGSDLSVEVCSKCHPFYTGKQKLLDSRGQVERFRKRYGANFKS